MLDGCVCVTGLVSAAAWRLSTTRYLAAAAAGSLFRCELHLELDWRLPIGQWSRRLRVCLQILSFLVPNEVGYLFIHHTSNSRIKSLYHYRFYFLGEFYADTLCGTKIIFERVLYDTRLLYERVPSIPGFSRMLYLTMTCYSLRDNLTTTCCSLRDYLTMMSCSLRDYFTMISCSFRLQSVMS